MAKAHLSLHQTEGIVFQAAAAIYAAFIQKGLVHAGHESEWRERAVTEAIELARITDDQVQTETEFS